MGRDQASSLLPSAVRSLHLSEDRTEILASISANQWPEILAYTDGARMTLPLAFRCGNMIPAEYRPRLDGCIERNRVRHARIVNAYASIAGAMESHGAEYLVLKGLTHGRLWSGEPPYRPQYDVDLYCPPASIPAALAAAASLGYEPGGAPENGADHLPVMIRRTGWRWRGDYYDPDQPLALELHHRLWNPTLGFQVHNAGRFWNRRRTEDFGGVSLPALHPVDRLQYAAWHAVRHLLRGSLRICHVYEIANFLHNTAADEEFWSQWRDEGAPANRLTESIAFRLAREWFGCRLNPAVEGYAQELPASVERWFRLFAFSPIASIGRPNKDELFLNLCLAQNGAERWRIAARRIFPMGMPVSVPDAHLTDATSGPRVKRAAQKLLFITGRAVHHVSALRPVVQSGFRWWLAELADRGRKQPLGT